MSVWCTGRVWDALEYAEVHLILEFKMMGLEIGGSFAGTFCWDFSWTDIYIGQTSILVFFVLLVLPCFGCEFVSASAHAERLLCLPIIVSKLLCTLCQLVPVCKYTLHQALQSQDGFRRGRNIGRIIVSQHRD